MAILIRRALYVLPVLALLLVSAVVVLAARAPRTWSAHWSPPTRIAFGAGQNAFAAVPLGPGRWDLLWIDDNSQQMKYTAARLGGEAPPVALDSGDVASPTLVRAGGQEVALWIRNDNGATNLMGAVLRPSGRHRAVRLLRSSRPIEHPYLFAGPGNTVDLVFSWQRYGNFDTFFARLGKNPLHMGTPRRLSRSAIYSFFPRAVTAAHGHIDMMHLENCCRQEVWHVIYERFDQSGRRLGLSRNLFNIVGLSPGFTPDQWAESLRRDPAGNIWGAVAGDAGAWLFEMSPDGNLLHRPEPVDPYSPFPSSIDLVVGAREGYVVWPQSHDLGTYLETRRFRTRDGALLRPERAVYEAGSQDGPQIVLQAGTPWIVWQASTESTQSRFETSHQQSAATPTIPQRLGLGLGNPWEEAGVLSVGSLAVATIVSAVNILVVFALTLLGLVVLRVLRWLPTKWSVYACLLACALYLMFVSPGAPLLFLDTLPALGLPAIPFGLLGFAGALALVWWSSSIPLRRLDDLYRAGIMAFLGVYFFAFLESVVFIQQRLGYI